MTTLPPEPASTPALPDSCDVAVIGAGLTGLVLAHLLADRVSVVVLHSNSSGSSSTERGLGIAAAGAADSPARLAQAVGEEAARSLWTASSVGIGHLSQLAEDLGSPVRRTGSWRLALDEREWAEWAASSALIQQWQGKAACLLAAPSTLGTHGLGIPDDGGAYSGGLQVLGDCQLSLPDLTSRLRTALQGRASIVEGPAAQIGWESDSVSVQVGDSQLKAELAVIAGGWASGSVHSWLAPALFPVRLQGLRVDPP